MSCDRIHQNSPKFIKRQKKAINIAAGRRFVSVESQTEGELQIYTGMVDVYIPSLYQSDQFSDSISISSNARKKNR
jgi:hypothetical protein